METSRWGGLKREERLCKQCRLEEVEDEEHFLLRCEGWTQEREVVTECMEKLVYRRVWYLNIEYSIVYSISCHYL